MVGLRPSYESIFEINPNSYEVVDLLPTKTTNLFFEKQTIQYLPAPYDTNCRMYGSGEEKEHRMAYKSENECNLNCKINYFQQHF